MPQLIEAQVDSADCILLNKVDLVDGDTAEQIAVKMTESEQIALLFESKRFEQKIMNVVPVAIMLYIGLTSPGYFAPLYGNLRGIALMSATRRC